MPDRNRLAVALAGLVFLLAGAALIARLSAPAVEKQGPAGPELAPIASTIVLPVSSTPAYTNEQLTKSFQEETGRMGITGISKPEEDGAPDGGGFLGERLGEPGTREQAEVYIRQLQAMRRPYEREKEKSVKLPGEKAGLLGETQKGGSAIDEKPAKPGRFPKGPKNK